MELPNGAFIRAARIGSANARWISRHGSDFFRDGVAIITQCNRVAVALRHFLSIQARQS